MSFLQKMLQIITQKTQSSLDEINNNFISSIEDLTLIDSIEILVIKGDYIVFQKMSGHLNQIFEYFTNPIAYGMHLYIQTYILTGYYSKYKQRMKMFQLQLGIHNLSLLNLGIQGLNIIYYFNQANKLSEQNICEQIEIKNQSQAFIQNAFLSYSQILQQTLQMNFLSTIIQTIAQRAQVSLTDLNRNISIFTNKCTPFDQIEFFGDEVGRIASSKTVKNIKYISNYFAQPLIEVNFLNKCSKQIADKNFSAIKIVVNKFNGIDNFSLGISYNPAKNIYQSQQQQLVIKENIIYQSLDQNLLCPQEEIVVIQQKQQYKQIQAYSQQFSQYINQQYGQKQFQVFQQAVIDKQIKYKHYKQIQKINRQPSNNINLQLNSHDLLVAKSAPMIKKRDIAKQFEQRRLRILNSKNKSSLLRKRILLKINPEADIKGKQLKVKQAIHKIQVHIQFLKQLKKNKQPTSNKVKQWKQQIQYPKLITSQLASSMRIENRKKLENLGFSMNVSAKYRNYSPKKYKQIPIQNSTLPKIEKMYSIFKPIPYTLQTIHQKSTKEFYIIY